MLYPLFDFDWFGLPIYFVMLIVGLWIGLKVLRKQQNGRIYGRVFLFLSVFLAFFAASIFSWFLFPGVFHIPFPQRIPFGGMLLYLGMLVFFGSSFLFRLKSADRDHWMHEAVPAFIAFSIFERIGASLAGFSFGVSVSSDIWFLQLFSAREIEAIGLLVMFFAFMYVKKHRFALYLLSYSVLRFVLEFFRGDDRGRLFISALSPTQTLVIFTWIGLLAWLLIPKFYPEYKNKLYALLKKEPTEREPFVYSPREEPAAPTVIGKSLRSVGKIAIGVFIVFAWLNPLNINGLRFMNVWMSEFIGSFGGERSVVTVITRDSTERETVISEDVFIEDIIDALILIETMDEFGGVFILSSQPQITDGYSVVHFAQTHLGIPVFGAGKQLIIDDEGYAQRIIGTSQFGFDGLSFPDYFITLFEAEDLFVSRFYDVILEGFEVSPFWYYFPEYNSVSAYRLTYIFSLSFEGSFLQFVMDAETGVIIDVLSINETNAIIHNRAITSVELNDSPALIRGDIDQPEARDVIIVNFVDRIPQRFTFNSNSPLIVTIKNSHGDIRALMHIVDEQVVELQPTYADEKYIIFLQSAGEVRHTLQQATTLSQPALLAASTFPFGFGTGRMVEDAIAAFQATYTVRVEPIRGVGSLSPESRDIVNQAVVHFNNSNGHAFLGLYRFDNVPLSDEIGAVLAELVGDDVASLFSRMNPHGMALGLQAFLVSYRAFNTTIGIIANTTNDADFRENLLAAWSDNPDKTVMAMILFMREIQSGQISQEQLMRLDDTTLNLFVLGEIQSETHREIGVRAELTGSQSMVIEATLMTQYFFATGNTMPFGEVEEPGFWGNILSWFTSQGEFFVINVDRTIEIAQGQFHPEDEDLQPFRSILPNWETEESRIKTIVIPEGDNLNLYHEHGAVIESIGTVGIARVTLIVRETGYTISWTPENTPMSVGLNQIIPSESLWRGNTYTIDVWASHSLDEGTGQRVGRFALVVRSRVEITDVQVTGSSVTIRGNYFMVGQINVILDTVQDGQVLQTEFRNVVADISDCLTQFSTTINNLPHGWYRPRVVGIADGYPERRFYREREAFEIGFRPVWPLPLRFTVGTSPGARFGYRIHPVSGVRQMHNGIDIAAPMGTNVYAVASGTVTVSSSGWNGGFGTYIRIDHGNGITTHYAHLSNRFVQAGQTVTQGQHIGAVGSTGVSTGPHLHFEIRRNGRPIDPETYLPQLFRIETPRQPQRPEVGQSQPGGEVTRMLATFAYMAYHSRYFRSTPFDIILDDNVQGWRVIASGQKESYSIGRFIGIPGIPMRYSTTLWFLVFQRDNDVVISFRGTPPLSIGSWRNTLSLFLDNYGWHPQHQLIADSIRSGTFSRFLQGDYNVYLTGHSLGGHLAVMAYREMLRRNLGDSVVRVETFNPVGVHPMDAAFLRGNAAIVHNYICCDIAVWASLAMDLSFTGRMNLYSTLGHACIPEHDWRHRLFGAAGPILVGFDAHFMANFGRYSVTVR